MPASYIKKTLASLRQDEAYWREVKLGAQATRTRTTGYRRRTAPLIPANSNDLWPHPYEPELDAFIRGKPIPSKVCRSCGEKKSLTRFKQLEQRGKVYRVNVCWDCKNKRERERNQQLAIR